MTEQPAPDGPRYQRHHEEKEEKDEKEHEKQEKAPADRLSGVAWAFVLIFAGVVFLLQSAAPISWLEEGSAWSIVLIGAGVIFGLEAVVRLLVPEYRRPIQGLLIISAVLVVVGASNLFGWDNAWPLLIIAAGVAILIGAFTRRQ